MSSPFDRVSKALEPLTDQPLVRRVLEEASALRDRTIRAQEATLGALNLPTAADLARLERRLRAMADGLDRLEDHVDRVERRIRHVEKASGAAELEALRDEIAALRKDLGNAT